MALCAMGKNSLKGRLPAKVGAVHNHSAPRGVTQFDRGPRC